MLLIKKELGLAVSYYVDLLKAWDWDDSPPLASTLKTYLIVTFHILISIKNSKNGLMALFSKTLLLNTMPNTISISPNDLIIFLFPSNFNNPLKFKAIADIFYFTSIIKLFFIFYSCYKDFNVFNNKVS